MPPVAVRCLVRLVTDGAERYAVVYGTDDSDNMRLEATRRDFVANVSHELKTPVGAIGLLTEALLESEDDPEAVRHFGERVITESVRMGNMVNELIALSRLQGAEKLHDVDESLSTSSSTRPSTARRSARRRRGSPSTPIHRAGSSSAGTTPCCSPR